MHVQKMINVGTKQRYIVIKDEKQSPVKEENESEGSITTGIHDVLIGGTDGEVIDADKAEEDR